LKLVIEAMASPQRRGSLEKLFGRNLSKIWTNLGEIWQKWLRFGQIWLDFG